jgi:hypothetical protein
MTAARVVRQTYARLAGFLYLFTNVTAALAFSARSRIMAMDDAARTAGNIAASERLFRLGIATELVSVACVIVLVVALYLILEPVGRGAALLAASWRLAENFVLAVLPFSELAMLALAKSGGDPALTRTFLAVYGEGFQFGFLFLGLGSALFSYLWWKSRYIPRPLAAWGLFASSVMAAVSLALIVWPGLLAEIGMAYMAPMGIYEIGLGLWLLVKGVKPAAVA